MMDPGTKDRGFTVLKYDEEHIRKVSPQDAVSTRSLGKQK
jgi:hypothetical protein